MNYVTNADYLHIGIVILIFAIICYLTYFAFSLSEYIVEKTSNNIITVIGKITGLIIAIIGSTFGYCSFRNGWMRNFYHTRNIRFNDWEF